MTVGVEILQNLFIVLSLIIGRVNGNMRIHTRVKPYWFAGRLLPAWLI